MKYPSLLFIFLAWHAVCICQTPNHNFSVAGDPSQLSGGIARQYSNLIDPAWRTATLEAGANWNIFNGIKGDAFYNEGWHKGYIILEGNKVAKDVQMNYNIYNNQIFYQYDTQTYVLDETASVVEFGISKKEDSNQLAVFRCGFPANGKNTTKTFYEVIVDNTISLMKHYNKSVVQNISAQSGVTEKTFFDTETLYVYDKGKQKIISLKKNREALLEGLPEYATTINSIAQQKKLKLKTEEDWKILIEELNKNVGH